MKRLKIHEKKAGVGPFLKNGPPIFQQNHRRGLAFFARRTTDENLLETFAFEELIFVVDVCQNPDDVSTNFFQRGVDVPSSSTASSPLSSSSFSGLDSAAGISGIGGIVGIGGIPRFFNLGLGLARMTGFSGMMIWEMCDYKTYFAQTFCEPNSLLPHFALMCKDGSAHGALQ